MVNGKQHWEMTPAELETELDGVDRRITKIVLSLFVFQVIIMAVGDLWAFLPVCLIITLLGVFGKRKE